MGSFHERLLAKVSLKKPMLPLFKSAWFKWLVFSLMMGLLFSRLVMSGGDPGIYAMAGLVFEMARERNDTVRIEVIPGIAALNACAARLGAPLMHDFAAISLSDLLTPWPLIEKRLTAAAEADFVIVLDHPKSKKRTEHIERTQEIIFAHRGLETPVGIVTAATRENEAVPLTTLEKMFEAEITMQSCFIIGKTSTFAWRDFMVTPRGYAGKYALTGAYGG